jgi:trans-aconitate methyltransferase
MVQPQIRYDDGAAYERMTGAWSRIAGEIFLDWLAPPLGLRWIDVGCGSGAFTELLVERCAPAEVQGIDPSEAQLSFARARPAACAWPAECPSRSARTTASGSRISVSSPLLDGYDEPEILPSSTR